MASSEAAVKAAWKAIDEERSYATDLTRKLVRIPSVNPKFIRDPDQNKESAVQDVVEAELKSIGMSIDRWDVFPDRPNVIGQLKGSEEHSLLLCGQIGAGTDLRLGRARQCGAARRRPLHAGGGGDDRGAAVPAEGAGIGTAPELGREGSEMTSTAPPARSDHIAARRADWNCRGLGSRLA